MADATDYGPTIADLERKRDEIDRTIAMLRAFAGLPSVEPAARPNGNGGGHVEFTNKHFFGMKAPEAVLLYLESVKEARNASQMARDLMDHGFITTSNTPSEVIRTALRRLEKTGQVVQVKKEWGLPGWYPGLRRPAKESGTDTEPRKTAQHKKASAKVKRSHHKAERTDTAAAPSAYQKFMSEQMAKGLDMKAAAAAWQEEKKAHK